MKSTGVVAALAVEARALGVTAPPGRLARLDETTLVYVSGIGQNAAQQAAERLLAAGATSLVSFGMAGGLDPQLAAGTICIPKRILDGAQRGFDTDLHRREVLCAALAGRFPVTQADLLTSAMALDTVAAKQAAFLASGAAAVDMESVAVARIAAARAVPCLAIRVIVDTARDTLPPAVMASSRDGGVNLPRLMWELLRSPGEIAALLRLSARYRAAQRSMRGVAGSGALTPLAMSGAGRVL